MNTPAERHLDDTPTKALLGIPNEAMDAYMARAYQLFQAGRCAEAEIVCRGLIAADHRYWWAYTLHAAVLLKLGRFADALLQVNRGLRYEPTQPKLVALRTEILKLAAEANRGRTAARRQSDPAAPRTSTEEGL